jgi:hypothetical protein
MQKDQLMIGGVIFLLIMIIGGGFWLYTRDITSEQRLARQIQGVEETVRLEFEQLQKLAIAEENTKEESINSMEEVDETMTITKGGDPSKSNVLYVDFSNRDKTNTHDVVKLSAEKTSEVLGKIEARSFGVTSLQLVGDALYFMNAEGGLSTMNVLTKTFAQVDIQGISPNDARTHLAAFTITGDTIYYLLGACNEAGPCQLSMAHVTGDDPILLHDSIPFTPFGSMKISLTDDGGIQIISSGGDGGGSSIEVYQFDLETKQVAKSAEYFSQYCDEDCDAELKKQNEAYASFRATYSPNQVQCGLQVIELDFDWSFVACI